MKYYTTIEQSKKLVELGIDVDTADMYYQYYPNVGEWYDNWVDIPNIKNDGNENKKDIPCWSTEALLDILDETIVTDNDDEYRLNFGKYGTSYYMFYEDVYRLVNNVID